MLSSLRRDSAHVHQLSSPLAAVCNRRSWVSRWVLAVKMMINMSGLCSVAVFPCLASVLQWRVIWIQSSFRPSCSSNFVSVPVNCSNLQCTNHKEMVWISWWTGLDLPWALSPRPHPTCLGWTGTHRETSIFCSGGLIKSKSTMWQLHIPPQTRGSCLSSGSLTGLASLCWSVSEWGGGGAAEGRGGQIHYCVSDSLCSLVPFYC